VKSETTCGCPDSFPRLRKPSQTGLPRRRQYPVSNPTGEPGSAAGAAKDHVDNNDKRDLYNGFGDGLALAFEFAVTPAIFGVLGYLLDRAVGTIPVFTILLALLCIVGMFVKVWYSYDASMREHEAKAPWGRPKQQAPGQGTQG
jgi:F0F1-type ATP synthase assembly protein I